MNLLVVLSALLTALTGVLTGVRPVTSATQEQVAAAARRPARAASMVTARPGHPLPRLSRDAGPAARAYALPAQVVAFFHRRRE